jgi:N-acetyl-gamma-glutamyl-phosphate reductase
MATHGRAGIRRRARCRRAWPTGSPSGSASTSATHSWSPTRAGKTPTERTHFSEVHGSLSAYGVFNHRHGAEIEQGLGREVTFTPHLVPLDRGILSTIYVRVPAGTTESALGDVLTQAYAGETFVRLTGPALPEIKHVVHTNFCDIGWRVEATRGSTARAILVSVIDNLVKGAAGQAVQNMNVMLGLHESLGLL